MFWKKKNEERETLDALIDKMNSENIREVTLNIQEFPEGMKRYIKKHTDYDPKFITLEEQKLIEQEKEYQVSRLKINDDKKPVLEITDRFRFSTTFRDYNNQKYVLNLEEASQLFKKEDIASQEITSIFYKNLKESEKAQ